MPNYCFYCFRADGKGEVSIKAIVHWLQGNKLGFHVFVVFCLYNFCYFV